MGLLSSIIGGVTSIINNERGISEAKKSQSTEMQFNAEQAQLNRDFQREERLASQEYNSVSSQIQRMMDAGVNPALAFSNGYQSAETTPMSGDSASYSSSLSSGILSARSQQALQLAQIANLSANTENTREQTKNITPKTKAEIAKIFSDIGVNDFNKDLQERTFALYQNKTDAELKVMNEQLNKLRNESLDILKGIELKDVQIAANEAETRLTEAQIQGQEATTELTQAQTDAQNVNTALQQVMLEYSNITGIPVGTPECHALFTLWSQGRMQDISDKLALNTAQSDNSINKVAGMTGVTINKIGRALNGIVKDIGSIFTK